MTSPFVIRPATSADTLDLERLAPRERQLPRVVLRHERLVGVRGQQLLGDLVPDVLEAFGAAERRRRDFGPREIEQPRPVNFTSRTMPPSTTASTAISSPQVGFDTSARWVAPGSAPLFRGRR